MKNPLIRSNWIFVMVLHGGGEEGMETEFSTFALFVEKADNRLFIVVSKLFLF